MSNISIIALTIKELAVLALQTYFLYARLSGMTPEQIEAEYQAAKKRFSENAPGSLPEV